MLTKENREQGRLSRNELPPAPGSLREGLGAVRGPRQAGRGKQVLAGCGNCWEGGG